MSKAELQGLVGATRQGAVLTVRDHLRSADIGEALEEARSLTLAACKLDALALLREPDVVLAPEEASILSDFAARRAAGEPASRIIGRRPFWSVDLAVRPDVLDPRADTETVVRLAKRLLAGVPPRSVLDLGSGSGALLCALLSEYHRAFGVAVDLSPKACVATSENLERCGLGARSCVVRGIWGQALVKGFDLVVSNPPYIRSADISGLPVEVRSHDPHMALDGGPDGLDAYQQIFGHAADLLGATGLLIVEIGAGQRFDVEKLAGASGLITQGVERDLGGHERAIAFRSA
ncbi:MAG: peptide chain release factor N(5)-glutamine methyltransferase [Beijerinckiaceae bacterium]